MKLIKSIVAILWQVFGLIAIIYSVCTTHETVLIIGLLFVGFGVIWLELLTNKEVSDEG